MKRSIFIIVIVILSLNVYAEKTYMQFKSEFKNMPIENSLQLNYNITYEEKVLLRSFIISTVAFTGSYIINSQIPNDQLNKKRLVSIIAASITLGVSIDYLYKTRTIIRRKIK